MKKLVLAAFCLVSSTSFAQKKQWVSLFDGKAIKGWHIWKTTEVKGWHVMDGVLMTHGNNGDLVTDKEYENFILEFEFKAAPKGNSGVIYKIQEDANNKDFFATYASGPEFQVIDDANYPNPITDRQRTGANYDVYAPSNLKIVKPAGEWNKGKIVINNNHIEHWLNGKKVVDYTYGNDKWKADVAKSKFANWAYAKPHAKGHIALQDHGDAVSYRKIRIKEL